MNLRWSSAALNDLIEIRQFVAPENPTAAERLAGRLVAAAQQLEALPSIGRPGRVAGTRESIVAPYIVAYRLVENGLEVLRVLHGARRWPVRF